MILSRESSNSCPGDHALAAAGGEQRRLVDEVHQIRAREAGRAARDHLEVDVGREGNLAHVDLEDLLATDEIGIRDHDLPVEAAGAQQRRVQHVGPVGRGDDDDALVLLEAVHLDEQLVEGLLALVVAAAEARAAMASDRVDFVDEDDAGGVLLGLLEHVAHAACADADEHLDEVRAGNGEERHVGFTRNGSRGQGLAGARRPDQQNAARDAPAELLEFLRIAQELDDLLQILLGLVDAGHVLESDATLRLGEEFSFRLAETHGLAGPALHLPGHVDPQAEEQEDGQDARNDRQEPIGAVGRRLGGDHHVLLEQRLDQRGVVRRVGLERAAVLHVAVDLRPRDRNIANVARLGVGEELAEGNLARRRLLSRALEQGDQGQHKQENDHPQGEVSIVRVHRLPVTDGRRRDLHPLPALSISAHLSAPARIAKRTARFTIPTLSDNCSLLAMGGLDHFLNRCIANAGRREIDPRRAGPVAKRAPIGGNSLVRSASDPPRGGNFLGRVGFRPTASQAFAASEALARAQLCRFPIARGGAFHDKAPRSASFGACRRMKESS